MAVDASELFRGSDQPGRAPAQRHLTVAPTLHVGGVISMIDSIALVVRNGDCQTLIGGQWLLTVPSVPLPGLVVGDSLRRVSRG